MLCATVDVAKELFVGGCGKGLQLLLLDRRRRYERRGGGYQRSSNKLTVRKHFGGSSVKAVR
jgi:hypothetical protein